MVGASRFIARIAGAASTRRIGVGRWPENEKAATFRKGTRGFTRLPIPPKKTRDGFSGQRRFNRPQEVEM